jgi:arsenate reductase
VSSRKKPAEAHEPPELGSSPCYLHEAERLDKERDALTIYHNPKCSKSRETLALIRDSGIEPRVIEYLKTPPGPAEIATLARKLGVRPGELIRTTESVFREKYGDRALSDKESIAAIVADPILMQRPIVVRGEEAVIGRPPENAKRLLR